MKIEIINPFYGYCTLSIIGIYVCFEKNGFFLLIAEKICYNFCCQDFAVFNPRNLYWYA